MFCCNLHYTLRARILRYDWKSNTIASPPVEVRNIAMSVSVCLSVFPLAYLKAHMSTLHEIFCRPTCCLWSWLGPPLTKCNMLCTSGFVGWSCFR